MRTAIDSSVLLSVLRQQAGWEHWRDRLCAAASEGSLLICPVVFAECACGYGSAEVAVEKFESLGIACDPISNQAAYLAGQTFLEYRRCGGPREHLIPDFLIAAHASVQADRLAAIDRGYLRRYFPRLALLGIE
jgi:predicted nucleic acid-binding protein